jgi:hypothetical protein
MTVRPTISLDELKTRSLEQVLREVAEQQEILTVRLPGGQEVRIEPVSVLKPLPVLKGMMPQGWKDGIHR